MKDEDVERIRRRYSERLARYGDDIRTLASGTEERRRIRYGVLRDVGIEEGSEVLDLGCGFGDFYGYLRDAGVDVEYVGYEINPDLLEVARDKYPSARFELRDVQREDFPEFDYVVSSSAFNLPLTGTDNYDFVGEILALCYEHARRGVAVDFLSTYADFQAEDAFHYRPERVFALAKELTKRVALRHDYPLFEFCVYLYPDFEGWAGEGRDG